MGGCASTCWQPSTALHLIPLEPLQHVNLAAVQKKIIKGKLAPFHPGVEDAEDADLALDECPICFMFFPILNTSVCCGKRICTTCMLMCQVGHAAAASLPPAAAAAAAAAGAPPRPAPPRPRPRPAPPCTPAAAAARRPAWR
jgi:hypothetical protein